MWPEHHANLITYHREMVYSMSTPLSILEELGSLYSEHMSCHRQDTGETQILQIQGLLMTTYRKS